MRKVQEESCARGISHVAADAWGKLVRVIKCYKVLLFHRSRNFRAALVANIRETVRRWDILFGFLFFLCVIVGTWARHLVEAQLRQAPSRLVVFVLWLAAMIVCAWLFFNFLPGKLLDPEWGILTPEDRNLAKQAVKTVWAGTPETKAEDDLQLPQACRSALQRRAYAGASNGSPSDEIELSDRLGGLAPVSSVKVFSDESGGTCEGSLLLHSGDVPVKRMLSTERARDAPRNLVECTPLQLSLKALSAGAEGLDRIPRVEAPMKVWFGTVQVVCFVDLPIGATEANDGVLSLWRSPEKEETAQLVDWFKEIQKFFRDYGASFQPGSGVYVVLQGLFWGLKEDKESGVTERKGKHLEDHKSRCMATKDGVAHEAWLERNFEDLINIMRLGPEEAQKADWGDVSDDEEDPERLKEPPPPARTGTPPRPSPRAETRHGQGTLYVTVVQANNLPLSDCARVECHTVQPPIVTQNDKEKSTNPKWVQLFERSFDPSQHTELRFQVFTGERELGFADIPFTQKLAGNEKLSRTVDLDCGPGPAAGCCVGAPAQPTLTIEIQFQKNEDSAPADTTDSTAASSSSLRRTKREQPCPGFCGGPLTWALLYPPTIPQLLHVAVTAEDLRLPQPASALLGGSPSRRSGGLPPLREQRVPPLRKRMEDERLEWARDELELAGAE